MTCNHLGDVYTLILLQIFMAFAPAGNLIYAQSTTSLFIPGFSPQPVSADIIGIGSDGRTTWALHKGQKAPGDTSSYDNFVGTATLVQGPSDAYLSYANSAAQFTVAESCTVTESTLAVCAVFGKGLSGTQTEVYTPIPVQVGQTLTGSVTILPITPSPGSASTSISGSNSASATAASSASSSSNSRSSTSQTASLPSNTGSTGTGRASTNKMPSAMLHGMAITIIAFLAS